MCLVTLRPSSHYKLLYVHQLVTDFALMSFSVQVNQQALGLKICHTEVPKTALPEMPT